MKVAIIGTGFLGEQIYIDIKDRCEEVLLTHSSNPKYPHSQKFDFFQDDFASMLGETAIDIVFLPAKIEFIEDSSLAKSAMLRFLAACKNAKIVYISSDGIFDGQRGRYREDDTPHPVTLYGGNLKLYEDIIKEHASSYCIIRPGYLYGFVNGKLDDRLKSAAKDAAEGKILERFTNMYKSPLSYQQASEAIIQVALSDFTGTLHISGERKSVYKFTKEGLEALGLPTENLQGTLLPEGRGTEFLPDTSLDYSLMTAVTGVTPFSIQASFEKFWPEYTTKYEPPKN